MNTQNVAAAAIALGVPFPEVEISHGAEPRVIGPTGALHGFFVEVLHERQEPTRIAAAKWEAARRIRAVFPDHQRENWGRYLQRLTNKVNLQKVELTEEEQTDVAFALAADNWINAVRVQSDIIEATEGLSPFAPEAPWPPMPDTASFRACPKPTG
jgi:hypothetical protein